MRSLRIDIRLLIWASKDKKRLDSLAFAVMVKEDRINSTFLNASNNNIKKHFHLGSDTVKRVISNGVEYNFIRFENDRLIGNKLHDNNGLSIVLKRKDFVSAINKNKKHHLSLNAVKDILLKAVLTNHIWKLNDVSDTHERATNGNRVSVIRSAKRRETRMLNDKFNDSFSGLSNIRIQTLLGCKHCKASRLVKEAINEKKIERKIREEYIPCDPYACTDELKNYYAELGEVCIVWKAIRAARLRISNTYRSLSEGLSFSNHGHLPKKRCNNERVG